MRISDIRNSRFYKKFITFSEPTGIIVGQDLISIDEEAFSLTISDESIKNPEKLRQ
jgi:hypothetical protein